jgi:hypothetical protein
MSNEFKGLLMSKTIWGVLIMVLGTILGWSAETQTVVTGFAMQAITAGMELFGAGLAVYGRVKAETKIKGITGKAT